MQGEPAERKCTGPGAADEARNIRTNPILSLEEQHSNATFSAGEDSGFAGSFRPEHQPLISLLFLSVSPGLQYKPSGSIYEAIYS